MLLCFSFVVISRRGRKERIKNSWKLLFSLDLCALCVHRLFYYRNSKGIITNGPQWAISNQNILSFSLSWPSFFMVSKTFLILETFGVRHHSVSAFSFLHSFILIAFLVVFDVQCVAMYSLFEVQRYEFRF